MVKMIVGFLVLFVLIAFAISAFSAASGREKIQLTKTLGYSMLLTVVTSAVVAAIVILF